jgi:hypothetical protein
MRRKRILKLYPLTGGWFKRLHPPLAALQLDTRVRSATCGCEKVLDARPRPRY